MTADATHLSEFADLVSFSDHVRPSVFHFAKYELLEEKVRARLSSNTWEVVRLASIVLSVEVMLASVGEDDASYASLRNLLKTRLEVALA